MKQAVHIANNLLIMLGLEILIRRDQAFLLNLFGLHPSDFLSAR